MNKTGKLADQGGTVAERSKAQLREKKSQIHLGQRVAKYTSSQEKVVSNFKPAGSWAFLKTFSFSSSLNRTLKQEHLYLLREVGTR